MEQGLETHIASSFEELLVDIDTSYHICVTWKLHRLLKFTPKEDKNVITRHNNVNTLRRFPALLTFLVTDGFPSGSTKRTFGVLVVLSPNKLLNNWSFCRWFVTAYVHDNLFACAKPHTHTHTHKHTHMHIECKFYRGFFHDFSL